MTEYPLEEILVIAFLAVLGNASGWYEIERFGNAKHKWLKKFLKLKNRIPSHDTFRRVFALIDPSCKRLPCCFSSKIWMPSKNPWAGGRKHGTTEEVSNLQTLHIYDASNGIYLCSYQIDSKTNEIPAAQEALKMLQLKHTIVTLARSTRRPKPSASLLNEAETTLEL